MTDLFFVDSNVLVYRRDASETVKQPLAAAWLEALWRKRAGRLSLQALQEFYAVVTRKLDPGLSPKEAQEEVEEYFTWRPLPVTTDLVRLAWTNEGRFRLSFWDALVVAAAQAQRCGVLLSEDLQDGQELDGVLVRNPFRYSPDDLGLG
jgi:predicted nucleic acid-binding protein